MNIRAAVTAILLGVGQIAMGQEPDSTPRSYLHLQSWLGAMDTRDGLAISDADSGETLVGDLGTLPFGGGAGQRLWGEGAVQFGFEGGGLVSWKNETTRFRATSDTVRIRVDNSFWSFGVFMGGVASVQPLPNLRLYVAGGPSITWAFLEREDDEPEPAPVSGGTIVIRDYGSQDDVSLVPYARAGIEVLFGNGLAVGVSARYARDEYDFGDSGELEPDELSWALTLGTRH